MCSRPKFKKIKLHKLRSSYKNDLQSVGANIYGIENLSYNANNDNNAGPKFSFKNHNGNGSKNPYGDGFCLNKIST